MIVVDASVAFKWLKSKDEPYHKQAVLILQDHISALNKIIVPHILFIEIANSLVTKTSTSIKTVQDDIRYLYKINLEINYPERSEIAFAAKLAKENKTSVYDMIYAAVAKKNKTILITADEKFIQKSKFSFVKSLREYVSGTKI